MGKSRDVEYVYLGMKGRQGAMRKGNTGPHYKWKENYRGFKSYLIAKGNNNNRKRLIYNRLY